MDIHPFSCRQTPHSIVTHQDKEDDTEDSGPLLAGGYNRGDAVTASRDLRHFLVKRDDLGCECLNLGEGILTSSKQKGEFFWGGNVPI